MTEVHPEPPATVVVTTNQTPVVVTTSPVAGPEVTQPGGYTVSVTTSAPPSTTVAPDAPAPVVVGTGGGADQNVIVAEGPPASVPAGYLYVELQGGAVNEFWTT